MQVSSEEAERPSSPSLSSEFAEEFSWKMNLQDFIIFRSGKSAPEDEETEDEDDDDEEEEEFTFARIGSEESTIAADDAFQNGQIKPIFPFFDQSLLSGSDSGPSREDLPPRPPVNKVFVEADYSRAKEVEAGNCFTWSGKVVEESPDVCKKSNSTGFSKIWRLRELTKRSNSDGKDAFVFLNSSNTTTKSSKREDKAGKSEGSLPTKTVAAGESNPSSAGGKAKSKAKKGKTPSLSAHELHYLRNRASKEEDRRRSYLPYRPEFVGFFTNVKGGLSRNVHPF